jgi:hypothetical protein
MDGMYKTHVHGQMCCTLWKRHRLARQSKKIEFMEDESFLDKKKKDNTKKSEIPNYIRQSVREFFSKASIK